MNKITAYLTFFLLCFLQSSNSKTYIVAGTEGDFQSIQDALNTAIAGDSILVKEKNHPYYEKLHFPRSGTNSDGFITLMAFSDHSPIVDGTGVNGSNMILIDTRDYIKVIGLELQNNTNVRDGSGIRVIGSGTHIELQNNHIHDMRGSNAMGITIYGTETSPISDLKIIGNEIFNCEPANSESLVLNGNISNFIVTHNIVKDVNNIGIDFIGGESDINPNSDLVARDGICSWNEVYNANSNYGGGYAAGIYVDGGRNITIENNIVSGCDIGLSIGAENSGVNSINIIVRNNLIYKNEKAGLHFGGYEASRGRVTNCKFFNNTFWQNDILEKGWGEIWIEYAEDNEIMNNIFYSNDQNILIQSEYGNENNKLDYNIWYSNSNTNNAAFNWNGDEFNGFNAFQMNTGNGSHSHWVNPAFVDPDNSDFHLSIGSPAINSGYPEFESGYLEVDIDGEPRIADQTVDIGADEFSSEIDREPPAKVKNLRIR